MYFFDCETAPLPEDYIRKMGLLPEFEPPGNIKDPAKIAEREKAHVEKALADAALSPITGCVCAIGWQIGNDAKTYEGLVATGSVTEASLLQEFWRHVKNYLNMSSTNRICGFNIKKFDLPFLVRRSWINDVDPYDLFDGRYWRDRNVIDLRERWTFGDRYEPGSLGVLATLLGIGEKNGSGEFFHKLLIADPVAAHAYLKNDVQLLPRLAAKMGVTQASHR